MRQCDIYIKETIELAKAMLVQADRGDAVREDTGCGILYGVLRDSALKIRQLAEAEKKIHIDKGWWKKE